MKPLLARITAVAAFWAWMAAMAIYPWVLFASVSAAFIIVLSSMVWDLTEPYNEN